MVDFVHLELFLFTLHIFKFFYPRLNKPNIHNNITGITSFHTLSSNGFYFKGKIIEASHKVKEYVFLTFGNFFSKCPFWMFPLNYLECAWSPNLLGC